MVVVYFLVGLWILSAWSHWFLCLPLGVKVDIDTVRLKLDFNRCHHRLLTNCGKTSFKICRCKYRYVFLCISLGWCQRLLESKIYCAASAKLLPQASPEDCRGDCLQLHIFWYLSVLKHIGHESWYICIISYVKFFEKLVAPIHALINKLGVVGVLKH